MWGWVVVGGEGRTPGGTALGGASRPRNKTTTSTMTNKTTPAIVKAAVQARARWRLRRALVAMFSCWQSRWAAAKRSSRPPPHPLHGTGSRDPTSPAATR
ncbi:hypothetical protein MPRS_36230 [Mycobacterium paraseoulense]|nr:hypothetical protein MPRS_36230 [Mycobacterium paraseoulense]